MSKIDIYTTSGEKKGSATLNGGRKASSTLISSAVLSNLSNKRHAIAHTKTRAEVSGGGKKPWKQKGTGRARVGSNRSPLWTGGGITFGPRNNASFYKRVNKKQKTLVLNQLLTKKSEEEKLKIIENIAVDSGKTRDLIKILASLGVDDSVLLILDTKFSSSEEGTKIYKAGRNISFLKIMSIDKVNAFMVLKYKWVVITKDAFDAINERFTDMEEKEKKVYQGKEIAGRKETMVKKAIKRTVKTAKKTKEVKEDKE